MSLIGVLCFASYFPRLTWLATFDPKHLKLTSDEFGLLLQDNLLPKHPYKVHIWAGISKRGATKVLMFVGIMDSEFYTQEILDKTLLLFIRASFPDGHRFQQDNDPKHTSRMAKTFMETNGINWWETPAESPDLNPIEMLWHELKHFLRTEVKPTTKDKLLGGIWRFWRERMTVEKCQKYINHLQKVMPIVIQREGAASGH